jgi:pantoate--beta-alanine ligase
MHIVDSIEGLRKARKALQGTVGLVPTMGYLHAGHLALVEAAKQMCDSVMATIFVNPTQFGEGEDLATYPRDMQRDLNMLQQAGVDLVFTPPSAVMYPPRFQTWVNVEEVTRGKEGAHRPKHFRGVATVVAKLFNLAQADVAIFGQKDAQQVVVIRQMVRDLNIPITIQICPIVRESDGLALSSRNVYLTGEERLAAASINKALQATATLYDAGERNPNHLRENVISLLKDENLIQLDYVSLANAQTLEEIVEPTDEPLLLSLAAQVGKPRLLDNYLLPAHLNTQEGATATLGTQS